MTEIDDKPKPLEKLGTTSPWERDKKIARNTPRNVVPSIPGAFIREKKVGGLVYYQLVKSYRVGEKIVQKVLRHYGLRPPRGAKYHRPRMTGGNT